MVYFPEREPDGRWVARQVFTRRIPHTADFAIDGAEFELYQEVTRFVKRQSARAAAQGDDPRARAVGFLMSLYQRRLASSTHAMRQSLENRIRRLEEGLKRAQTLAQTAPPTLPDPEDIEEMEDTERERLEEMIEAITLAGNAEQVREEIAELKELADKARAIEATGLEAKLGRLKGILQDEGFFDRPDQRLLLFTEFKDTLDYLVAQLKGWGFRVGFIHGGMKPGSREEPGSRIYVEQQFRDGEIQVLVATEAAGEGINLQCCHILFNYDIPWNPNRLEQRMGRIHRYGQRFDCLIFNFVATNTIEGRVLQRLLHKLQEIRDALDDDAVFNVVGEVLPAAHIERVLRDYYAGRLGDVDLEDRLLRDVDENHFRAMVMAHEAAQGRNPEDVHEKNLGYDIKSVDHRSGELRLIEVKGLGGAVGSILLTPNERRVAEDRRDCYWLYVVTNCNATAELQEPVRDPARFPWHEVVKVQHYWLEVDAMTRPMEVRERKQASYEPPKSI